MLETIQQQITETHDRQAVMILLQGLDAKLAILKIKTPTIEGELWFAKGKHLVFGKANPGGDLPLLDMLRLLAIKDGDFSLETRDEEPPRCQVPITLAELVADEHAVARKIKDVLWPVDPMAEAELAEEVTKERLRRLETTKSFGNADDIATKQKTGDEATGAEAGPVDEDATVEIRLPPAEKAAAKAAAGSADVAEESTAKDVNEASVKEDAEVAAEAADKKPAGDTTEVDVEKTSTVAEGADKSGAGKQDAVESTLQASSAADEDEAHSQTVQLDFSPRAADEADKLDILPPESEKADKPDAGSAKDQAKVEDVSPIEKTLQSDLSDYDPEETMQIGLPGSSDESEETIGIKLPESDDGQPSVSSITIDETAVDETQPVTGTGGISGEGSGTEKTDAEGFYAHNEAMSEEAISQRRALEMEALNKLLADHGKSSKDEQATEDGASEFDGQPTGQSVLESSGKLKSKRQADYEALKMFYSEEADKFYEKSEIPEGPQVGLDDFKKRILELAGDELSDKQTFDSRDPRLKEGGNVRPTWNPDLADRPPAEPAAETTPAPAAATAQPADAPASPYADMASALVRGEVRKTQLGVAAQSDDLALFERPRVQGHTAGMREAFQRRPPLPAKVVIAGVAVAVLIPVVTFVIWHYFDAQAQEETAEQREAALLAERALEQKSVVAKPQEAFRMPAGSPVNSTPPSAHSSSSSSGSAQGISSSERDADFEFHQANAPAPSSDQISSANSEMQKADAYAQSGNYSMAIYIYSGLIRRYPTYALLRAKAAHLCLTAKQYRQAYDICVAGMSMCSSRSDFDMLRGIIQEIPAH